MKKITSTFLVRVKNYYQSHIWCSFVLIFAILVLFTIVVIQGYLKHEYKNYIKDKTYNTEKVVLSSINQNLSFMIKEFVQIAAEISVDDNLYQLTEACEAEDRNKIMTNRNLLNALSRYSQYSQWIENVCVTSDKGMLLQYDRKNYKNEKFWDKDNEDTLLKINSEVFSLISEDSIPRYFAKSYFLSHPEVKSLYVFHIAVPLKGDKTSNKIEHTAVISFNIEVLGEFLNSVHTSSEDIGTGYITDADGNIIYHKDKKYIGEKQEEYLSENNLQNISGNIDDMGWKINIAIDEMEMKHQVDEIYSRGVVFYLVILLLIVAFLFMINRLVLIPVVAINQSILKVKKGNLNNKIVIQGKHEIWELAEEYNKMIDSLQSMNDQVEKHHQEKLISMKKQQRAEREALESQINAHFICNTLGSINYEVMESGNHKVSILIKNLSNILRYTFDQKHQNVYMLQELAWIKQYLFLQKFRLEEVFDYSVDFSEEFDSWPCRKLMLEPFVENSILHGFEGRQDGGIINIIGEAAGERLKLVIEDNGIGMDKETEEIIQNIIKDPLSAEKGKIGIGISNVVTRMQMYYGSNLSIELYTCQGEGTRFTFYLPMPDIN